MTQRLIQAYRQAPWRIQRQRISIYLTVLLAIVLVSGMYLYISTEAATNGLKIIRLEAKKEETLRGIADDRTKLAEITSSENMKKRAEKLGFVPGSDTGTLYVPVPGFTGQPQDIPLVNGDAKPAPATILKPSYTESLWEWLFKGILRSSQTAGGTK